MCVCTTYSCTQSFIACAVFCTTTGVIFCVGGRGTSGDPFKTIECYDIRQDKWFNVADMSSKRRHVGVVSYNGMYAYVCSCTVCLSSTTFTVQSCLYMFCRDAGFFNFKKEYMYMYIVCSDVAREFIHLYTACA